MIYNVVVYFLSFTVFKGSVREMCGGGFGRFTRLLSSFSVLPFSREEREKCVGVDSPDLQGCCSGFQFSSFQRMADRNVWGWFHMMYKDVVQFFSFTGFKG